LDVLGRPSEPEDVEVDLGSSQTGFAGVIRNMKMGQSGIETIDVGDRELLVAYSPLVTTGWSIASVVPSSAVLQDSQELQNTIYRSVRTLLTSRVLPVSIALIILLTGLGLLWTNRLVQPIQHLSKAVQETGSGDWEVEIPDAGKNELGSLARAFVQMRSQLRETVQKLEERVFERTQDLQRRTEQIQTASEIARDIASSRDLDKLLDNAVQLIRDRFGYYHAGIFLVDEQGEYAQLRAATGDAGAQLLERRHRLKVGEVGLVGFVTGTGKARIALDVGEDAVHFKNPFLPNTRSELALPLLAGDRVIGALDVQSTEPAAFDDEDVTILQTLADQLATAIENTLLLSRLEAAVKETGFLVQQQVQDAWVGTAGASRVNAYEYDRLEVRPAQKDLPEHLMTKLREGQTVIRSEAGDETSLPALFVPVMLRDELIGVIGLEPDDPTHHWTDDEIAIVEATASQAAVTLENARLFQETRAMAERERLVANVTARMRESLDLETVLRTAVREMGQALSLAEVSITLETEDGVQG
jgi:GAF domain-containing protein/HAMP domain-containing protein